MTLPPHIIRAAQLYAPGRPPADAVSHVVEDYGRLVSEVRALRVRVAQVDEEGAALDSRLEALQAACRAILEL